ncbi:hypothetical protein EYA84_25330 [Verrucosispora sp. SN26_14.1]|uniref:hypothetical protein n=1 Tax=Verrucosispora sp. SN26_14.1 TaxID=2527879 RepID=UPI00103397C8|nr:hypothetical protein [Verrucosispora sp. SN26_14.1]TBL29076.1 hypothetical protein EYA84_25330 [Verrucosispora sp. SN26_14.1]
MTDTITNPAPAPLATATVTTDSGPIVLPCEPISEWLAITPVVGMDKDGKTWFDGGFTITHLPTGLAFGEGPACINCCRSSGQKFAAMDTDWSALTAATASEWAAGLSDADRETLMLYRPLEWRCDAELCDAPEATEQQAEPAASIPGESHRICRDCGATTGLVMAIGSPLEIATEWVCADAQCRAVTR